MILEEIQDEFKDKNKKEIDETNLKLLTLEKKVKELEEVVSKHRHEGEDGTLGLRKDIKLDTEKGISSGNSEFAGFIVDPKDALNERFNTVIITGKDKRNGIQKESGNSQLTFEHQEKLDETFIYCFRPPLFSGSGVSIVEDTDTFTQNNYSWEDNELLSYFSTPAFLNIYASNGVLIASREIVSNTSNTITVNRNWDFSYDNCLYFIWKPMYFGSADYPFKRIYLSHNQQGGIRFGVGSSSNYDENVCFLYTKEADGKLYYKGTDGIEKEIAFVA